jgi:hypothetical protein
MSFLCNTARPVCEAINMRLMTPAESAELFFPITEL